jgi:hypothetical protein
VIELRISKAAALSMADDFQQFKSAYFEFGPNRLTFVPERRHC